MLKLFGLGFALLCCTGFRLPKGRVKLKFQAFFMVLCLPKIEKTMRKTLLFISLLLVISCNKLKENVEGVYYYVESNDNNAASIYSSIGCSMVGAIKLEDGYYYNELTGKNMRLKYEVVDDKIIVDNQGYQLVLNIIDEETIKFSDCLFRKENDKPVNKEKEIKTSTKNTTQTLTLSKDSFDTEPAYIKDIHIVENEIYIVLDIAQIKYLEDDIKIINENPKLRTYKISSGVLVRESDCKEQRTSKYFIDNKTKILSEKENFRMISTNTKGELTYINFGCWS